MPTRIPLNPRIFYCCLGATLIVASATAVRMEFLPSLGMRAPFLTLYPAVFVAALYDTVVTISDNAEGFQGR